MTQEEKAKKYDEVVCKLRRFMEQGIDPLITRADVQDFFPELCESEDEKVRKTLIRVLNENVGNGIEKYGAKLEDALAWLEKQGQPRMQYGITINGVEYELIEDNEADECERCALKGQCNNIGDDALCNAIFGSDIVDHRRFKKKTK